MTGTAINSAIWRTILVAICLHLLALPGRADGAVPILQLDSGGHMALIRNLRFTADGTHLVSASDDKVVRVWDLKTGRTERTIRGEVGDGEAGKVYAIALSPDGRWLAVGGHTAMAGETDYPVRLYDFASGKLVKLLHGHTDSVLSLDFSSDGRRLVSGGVDDTAIIWDVATGAGLARLVGHKGDVNTVRFSRDGTRVFTASDDGEVGMWRASDGRRLKRMPGHDGIVIALAVSPLDGTVASGGLDGTIRLWDGNSGRFLGVLGKQPAGVMALDFSSDGRRLVSGIGAGASAYETSVWDVATGRRITAYGGHDNIVLAAAFSPDGRLVATAGGNNNEIHLWEAGTAKLVERLAGVGEAVWAVGFSPDGGRIAWGHRRVFAAPNDLGPLQFDLRLPDKVRLAGEPRKLDDADAFIRVVTHLGALSLEHRSSGKSDYFDLVDIKRDGQRVASIRRDETDGYANNTYGFAPDGQTVFTGGGNGFLSAYGLDGGKLGDFAGHTGDVWAIAVSPDGGLLLSGSDDQTLRLWNAKTGENIVSLFAGSDGEWVMWTPQGYYAASPGGDHHVGWHVNQGADKAARFVTAAQLKQHFYRPDIVTDALRLRSARQAAAKAGDDGFSIADLTRRRPPDVSVTVGGEGSRTAHLAVKIDESENPATNLDVVVDGRLVRTGPLAGIARKEGAYLIEVPLAAGDNAVRVTVSNDIGRSVRDMTVRGVGGTVEERGKGTLYLLAVGVDDYPNFNQNLKFAGADARAFRDLAIATTGRLHSAVKSLLLVKGGDQSPTAAAVLGALEELQQAGPDDTVMIFMAGHGVNDGADYLFLPSDARYVDGKWVADTVVSWRRLQDVLDHTRGQRILLVDTCHAGNAFNPRLIKDSADASIALMAATDGETLAQERPDIGHGVFTEAVLEGMKGKADASGDRRIRVKELSAFVASAVKMITQGKQQPTSFVPDKANFVVSPL